MRRSLVNCGGCCKLRPLAGEWRSLRTILSARAASLQAASAEVLIEGLSSRADENKQLLLRHTHDSNSLALRLRRQDAEELTAWNKERLGQLPLVRLCFV